MATTAQGADSGRTVLEVETRHGTARVHLGPGDAEARAALVLGHGAGGTVEAPDLVEVERIAVAAGYRVALVEQPYRVRGQRVPPRAPTLDAAWEDVVAALRAGAVAGLPLVVGGRSSGARVACRTADATGAIGVLCLAFPVRPPGKAGAPDRLHELAAVRVPVLVVQGAADPFGRPPAGGVVEVVVVDGDHSLRKGVAAIGPAVEPWLRARVTRGAATTPDGH
ncbi:alpha/beta family hydrolase [Actinotalea sp. Marseille-Q4924]|uniref:alpha/beta hydrolase family protein n=1 Tax=Actinotalea sp. Marseille-Q4924 TaxID=2866571 RepID=UPI001CE43C5F|nr:alpha/beta family hydrolase [Actinotalea sp. Marseille-Q4924]